MHVPQERTTPHNRALSPRANQQGPVSACREALEGGPPKRPAGETLVQLEREKLVVLRGIEGQLERQYALQEEMVLIKRQKFELQQRLLALAGAQFHCPSISVPIILPQDGGKGHFYFISLHCTMYPVQFH